MRFLVLICLLLVKFEAPAAVTIIDRPPVLNLGGAIVLPAPIVWLKFNEGSGTNLLDSSSNGNDFWLANATWITGQSGAGSALQFNGTNQWAQSSNSITFGVKTITVCAWVWWNTFANDSDLLWELSTNSNNFQSVFSSNPNSTGGTVSCSLRDTGVRTETNARPSGAAWHHWAIIYDNSSTAGDIKIFIDGVEQSTTLVTNAKTANNNFRVDKLYLFSRAGTSLLSAGRLDDFRIYGQELTSGQIIAAKADSQ